MGWKHVLNDRALPRNYYVWDLDRPQPALPIFLLVDVGPTAPIGCWTIRPAIQGCYPRYFKASRHIRGGLPEN